MPLLSCFLCQGLAEPQQQRLVELSGEVRLPEGEWLFHEGQEAGRFYVLKQGSVELLTRVDDFFELPITVLRTPGDCFGSSALITPYTYSLSARCLAECTFFAVKLTDLQQLIAQDYELGYRIMTNLANHLLNRLRETRQELKTHFRSLFKSIH
jgi:CRP/FNR family cyclic AMP-dependent transcriptional regulator